MSSLSKTDQLQSSAEAFLLPSPLSLFGGLLFLLSQLRCLPHSLSVKKVQ